jgi:hypothetical protein
MPRYNCSFSIEKNSRFLKKFEVIESESNNKEYVIGLIQKKYPTYSINIKYIRSSINGKSNDL